MPPWVYITGALSRSAESTTSSRICNARTVRSMASSRPAKKSARDPSAAIAMRGRLIETTPRLLRPTSSCSPAALVHGCRKERQPIGVISCPPFSSRMRGTEIKSG